MPQNLTEKFQEYKARVLNANTHDAKRMVILSFLQSVFADLDFNDVIHGLEQRLKHGFLIGRKKVKEALSSYMEEIDGIVSEILGIQA